MSADRCRVVAIINGAPQYYQRETEQKREGRWVAIPYFVLNPKEAVSMSEAFATAFVKKLQGQGVKNELWIEDCRDGRRIDVAQESQQSGEDNRVTMIATLNGVDEYLVKPTARPSGRCWFLRIDVPGLPDPQIIYADDPLAVLQRAVDMNFLQFAVKYVRPQPQAPIQNSNGVIRRRPGALRQ